MTWFLSVLITLALFLAPSAITVAVLEIRDRRRYR